MLYNIFCRLMPFDFFRSEVLIVKIEEKTAEKSILYSGKIINLRKDTAILPDGSRAVREVVEHPGGVSVVPITEDGMIILVEQFRYPYMEATLEIPAGKRDSRDEDPLECGKRELGEETGAVAERYTSLGVLYPTPGYCDEVIHMFAATGLGFGKSHPDSDEFLNTVQIPLERVVDMILSGEIKDAKTQAAVLKAYIMIQKGDLL